MGSASIPARSWLIAGVGRRRVKRLSSCSMQVRFAGETSGSLFSKSFKRAVPIPGDLGLEGFVDRVPWGGAAWRAIGKECAVSRRVQVGMTGDKIHQHRPFARSGPSHFRTGQTAGDRPALHRVLLRAGSACHCKASWLPADLAGESESEPAQRDKIAFPAHSLPPK